MKAYNTLDLQKFCFGNPRIEKHITKWMYRDPENRAHQIQIQSLKNLYLEEMHSRYLWKREELIKWKVGQLSLLVDWAYETTDFYRKKYGEVGFKLGDIQSLEDFVALPTLSREEVIQAFTQREIVSKLFDPENCRWFFSSGSSGTPVQIISTQGRTELDTLYRHRMFEVMANSRFKKNRWIYNINHAHWWHTSFNGDHPVFTISQMCPVEDVIEHLARLKPVFVSCIASYASKLAEKKVRLVDFGIEGVSTNSETTTRRQRLEMAEIFGVPVCDEYSSEEAGLLAGECRHGKYHCVDDDTHLELADINQQGLGRILATDLWNFAMPILKYEQGDFGKESTRGECACGSAFSQIESIQGRTDEAFISRSGEKICASEMLELAENFLSMSGMGEYKVIQRSTDYITINFVRDRDGIILNEKVDEFCQQMKSMFGHDLEFAINEHRSMGTEKRSKRKIFINDVQ